MRRASAASSSVCGVLGHAGEYYGHLRRMCNAGAIRYTTGGIPTTEDPMITNAASGTNVHEIAPGIYRINTPVDIPGGPSFNFNQYLIADDEPLLFHTGPRRMFPLVAEAIGKVLPLATPALRRLLARRGRRVRRAERLPRRRAARGAGLRPDRGDGLRERPRRPPRPGARRRRGPATSAGTRCAGSTPRTCRTAGSAAS